MYSKPEKTICLSTLLANWEAHTEKVPLTLYHPQNKGVQIKFEMKEHKLYGKLLEVQPLFLCGQNGSNELLAARAWQVCSETSVDYPRGYGWQGGKFSSWNVDNYVEEADLLKAAAERGDNWTELYSAAGESYQVDSAFPGVVRLFNGVICKFAVVKWRDFEWAQEVPKPQKKFVYPGEVKAGKEKVSFRVYYLMISNGIVKGATQTSLKFIGIEDKCFNPLIAQAVPEFA